MASIENRSRFKVAVQNRDDLTKTFPYSAIKAVKAYVTELRAMGFRPKPSRLNDSFAVRVRQVGYPEQCLFATSEEEALELQQRLESERKRGLFVDYGKARRITFADLLMRYLREEAPRHKGFVVKGYVINAILDDAGLPRVDLAQAYADHKNPHPALANEKFRKPSGKKMHTPTSASCFILKSFAELLPTDFNDYIDERCQDVAAATVDRAIDLFSATCRLAINTWRIPVAQSPMDGVKRPKYFNERDRRLKDDEQERLLAAARVEDARQSAGQRLEELMVEERAASRGARTVYERKGIIKAARAEHGATAEATARNVPMIETFVNFQLMTGARRSETLALKWDDIDFESQSAFLAETKNGRSRRLPLRSDLTAKGAKRLTGPEVRTLMSGAKMEGNAWTSGAAFTSTMNPNGTFDGVTSHGRKFDGTWTVSDADGQACIYIRNAPPAGSPCAYTYGLNGTYYISDTGESAARVVERKFSR